MSRVRTLTEQDCRDGIAAALARLETLGTSEDEVRARGPQCHHEWEAWDELRTWRWLLTGSDTPQDRESQGSHGDSA